jgi:hypothetical protein
MGWDSEMVGYAYLLPGDKHYTMYSNGNGYGASDTGVAVVEI